MTVRKHKRIAVISMARNAGFFVRKWISYYSAQFGAENLYLVLDGHDQAPPPDAGAIHCISVPHLPLGRLAGDRNRARLVSHLARSLFMRYDIVIAHDIDEYLVIDPALGISLSDYLQRPTRRFSASALGLDVGQHTEREQAIDPERPFLQQRSYAHVSARYTKAVVAFRPLTWGSGFHRVKGKNFHIDPNLFLFHFGMVDYKAAETKTGDRDLIAQGWMNHFGRRNELFDLIRIKQAREGDAFFATARRRQNLFRPFYALNKPGMLREKPIIKIPQRFQSVI